MSEMIIRQISPERDSTLYSQVLNLRNQLLRIPIGLDIFQEDLSQEVNHITFVATTRTTETTTQNPAKSNDNTPKEIGSETKSEEEKVEAAPEKVVACILLAPDEEGDGKTLKIRQMAVSPEFQGQGLGAKMVQCAETYAKEQGKTRLILHGRKHAVGFYLKAGFTKTSEQEFLELGIPHHALEKVLV